MTALKLPTWVEKLVPGQWYEIPSSAPNAVMANRAIVNAWNSFSVDPTTSRVWSVACGGHTDWAGNQVDMIDLETEAPAWTQVRASDHNGVETCVEYYASGSPCSRHTYYGHLFNAVDKRIMLPGGAWACSTGTPPLPNLDSYNIATNTFNASGTHPDLPAAIQSPDVAYCADPVTGDIYAMWVTNFAIWTRSTNTWSEPSGGTNADGGTPCAFDSLRRRAFFLGGIGFPNPASDYYDVGGATWKNVTVTGPRAVDVAGQQQAAMCYVPELDAYLIRQHPAGNDVIMVDADRFIAHTLPTIIDGTSLQDNNPYTQPNNDGAGPYNKFLYVPRLQGCVFVNGYTMNTFFLRLVRDSQTPFSRNIPINQRAH